MLNTVVLNTVVPKASAKHSGAKGLYGTVLNTVVLNTMVPEASTVKC